MKRKARLNDMTKSVRLTDIAEKMGVSVVTVSKALSGKKGVSEELRAKIRRTADEMGYRPVHALQPDKSKAYTVGVVAFERHFNKIASFYWKMYQELTIQAIKQNCFTMLEVVAILDEENLVPPKLFEEERVDGIIIIGKPGREYVKMLYQNKKIPMVFLDFYDDELLVDSVISESFHGMYRMTEYLLQKGHEKIAFVGTVMYTESITDRYFGYCKALMEHGIEVRPEWVMDDRNTEDGCMGLPYKVALDTNDMPTAFVCNNDVTAYALIKQLKEEGFRVPEDISVAGYDDYLYAEFGDSKITTYAVDIEKMTQRALQILIKRMLDCAMDARVYAVSGRLIERKTVKKLN